MRKWISGLTVLALAATVASANDHDRDHERTTNGTYYKGPAVGGRDIFNRKGTVLTITGEGAVGSMSGEPFTGSVNYTIHEEKINFVKEDGWFHATMDISKPNGDKIVVLLDGKTTGVDPATSPTVNVSGTWQVASGTGKYSELRGSGTFAGVEQLATGVTNGTFSGTVRDR